MERPTGGTPAASALARHCEATGVSLPRCGVVNGQLGIGYCGIMALRNWGITILSPYDFGAAIAACLIPSPAQPGPARPIPLPPHRQAQWRVIAARSASAPYRRSARAHAQRLNPSPAQPDPAIPTPLPEQTTKDKGLWLHSATRSQATILYFAFTSGPLARTRALTRGGGGEAPEARRPPSARARSSAPARDASRS